MSLGEIPIMWDHIHNLEGKVEQIEGDVAILDLKITDLVAELAKLRNEVEIGLWQADRSDLRG